MPHYLGRNMHFYNKITMFYVIIFARPLLMRRVVSAYYLIPTPPTTSSILGTNTPLILFRSSQRDSESLIMEYFSEWNKYLIKNLPSFCYTPNGCGIGSPPLQPARVFYVRLTSSQRFDVSSYMISIALDIVLT